MNRDVNTAVNTAMNTVSAAAPDGVPEVRQGDDLVALLLAALPADYLADGDVVVVTSKAVSKAEGRVVTGAREDHLVSETARVVARRGLTTIVRTRHGLTLAAAGIDASNVELGSSVLLPVDPDTSARRLRADLVARTGRCVAVVVTDTAGRAWREGQTDIAIGAAGLLVIEDFAGRIDQHGNLLAVTAPAVADEIAGLAELASGKLGGRPFVVVRGRADLVLGPGDDGRGAAALVRAEGDDLFGFGAREAVLRAVRGDRGDRAPFGSPVAVEEFVAMLVLVLPDALAVDAALVTCTAADETRLAQAHVVAFAHGWLVEALEGTLDLRIRPFTP